MDMADNIIKLDLSDTIEWMSSDDYKERLKAEYYQAVIRHDKLVCMVAKYHRGKLTFKPECPYELLEMQIMAMDKYIDILKIRAQIEHIPIKKIDVISDDFLIE